MEKKVFKDKSKIDAVFSQISDQTRTLYLYAPPIDKYAVHASFLSEREEGVYVTNEEPKLIKEKLGENLSFDVMPPWNIDQIKTYQRILIDGGSMQELETMELSEECKEKTVLCTHNITKLDPNKIKTLANQYNKLILSTDSATVLSSKETPGTPPKEINNGMVDEFVKRELKTIVLALLAKTPMCGREIKLEIYQNFNILLSSGTLYPLLHELEKTGLLQCHHGIKTKTYEPVDRGNVLKLVNDHIHAKNHLNKFLQLIVEEKEIVEER